jgi:hypothetical protein
MSTRVAGQRHRDHDALAHAARELVRVLVDALLGRGDADQPQHLDRADARLLLLTFWCRMTASMIWSPQV